MTASYGCGAGDWHPRPARGASGSGGLGYHVGPSLWQTTGSSTSSWENRVIRILLIGQQPETVDFSDPALPPGFDAAKIHAGLALAAAGIAEQGWQGDICLVAPDDHAGPMVERQLATARYDCVVIGGGVRLPAKNLELFETVVNAVHKAAPQAVIAFNTRPEDTVHAAARHFKAG